jgi:hypothetical protein
MDDDTLTALRGSIAKWRAIATGEGYDGGTDNCPLCTKFYDQNCSGCPVAEKTGFILCWKSPYAAWAEAWEKLEDEGVDDTRHVNGVPPEHRARFVRLALDEVAFLESLLPAGETP